MKMQDNEASKENLEMTDETIEEMTNNKGDDDEQQ